MPTLDERLSRVTGNLTSAAPTVVSKDSVFEAKRARYGDDGGLADMFIDLASVSKAFSDLGNDAVLENPREYLRAKRWDDRLKKNVYKVSNKKLEAMIQTAFFLGSRSTVAEKKKTFSRAGISDRVFEQKGIAFGDWGNHGGASIDHFAQGIEQQVKSKAFDARTGDVLSKALDASGFSSTVSSSGASVLVRVDLEELIYEAYLRYFPIFDVISKTQANGLTHSWNVRTDPGPADIIAELGSLTSTSSPAVDGSSTYARRQSSNVAVLAARRAISLKLQYAIAASGMGYQVGGTGGLEVMGAITAVARTNQALFFQGNQNSSANTGTAGTEDGLYNANGYTGVRQLLKGAGNSITLAGGQSIRDGLDQSVGQIMNAGGNAEDLLVLTTVGGKRAFNAELQQFLRLYDQTPSGGFPNNLGANGLISVSDDPVRPIVIPAKQNATATSATEGIGHYILNAVDTEDMYVIDPEGLEFAYLGSPDPVILELPIAYDNTLSNSFVIFQMNTLALKVAEFHRKLRIPFQLV